ncbi:MAG: hypothetical protein M3T55_14995 [Pseudomonadota bacterium]|nr:hypothetical protein [Pseudomonadota bacterium]
MDFTYFVAGFIALVVGLVAGIVFVIIKGRSKRRLIATGSVVAVALDAALLINRTHIGEASAALILVDCLVFTIYSVVGCAIGTLPALLARSAWRSRPGKNA